MLPYNFLAQLPIVAYTINSCSCRFYMKGLQNIDMQKNISTAKYFYILNAFSKIAACSTLCILPYPVAVAALGLRLII